MKEIFIGIGLIVLGFIVGRMGIAQTGEVAFWFILIAFGLFISGLMCVKFFWKNNVSSLNTQHNVNGFGGKRYKGRW